MKAKSKAAKLAVRRGQAGRKKLDLPRTPSGQISRSYESEAQRSKLALEAGTWRRRQENPALSVEDARKQELGSVVHRWYAEYTLFKKKFPKREQQIAELTFTGAQKDTAVYLQELREAWLMVQDAKRPKSASDFNRVGGYDGSDPFLGDHARWQMRVCDEFKQARRAILESGPMGYFAVETIVYENNDAPRLRGDLRLALNAVANVRKVRAAA